MLRHPALPLLLLLPAACNVPAAAPAAPPAPPAPVDERPVRTGLNDGFIARDVDVGSYVDRFEGESREVAREREAIADTLGLRAGADVADIGAGTGLFLPVLSKRVGPTGRVYAVDIAENFIEHLRERARAEGLDNVQTVLGTERSCLLAEGSLDVAFTCDTYHHFTYPRTTLHSILLALRPGGRLVVVDFERIPGESSEWILGHVRAGKDEVRAEIEAAGFTYVGETELEGLEDNYLIQFVRP